MSVTVAFKFTMFHPSRQLLGYFNLRWSQNQHERKYKLRFYFADSGIMMGIFEEPSSRKLKVFKISSFCSFRISPDVNTDTKLFYRARGEADRLTILIHDVQRHHVTVI